VNFKKIFLSLTLFLFAVVIFFPTPTDAKKIDPADLLPVVKNHGDVDDSFEKFLRTLPRKTGTYKSRQQPILVSGAMNIEISDFVYALKNPVLYRHLNYIYIAGTYKGYPIVVSRTEENESNAAATTALALKFFKPVAVINTGIAGAHIPNLKINDIVIGGRSVEFSAYYEKYQPEGAGIDITNREMRGTAAYDKTTGIFTLQKEFFADKTLLDVAKKVADTHEEFTAMVGTLGTANTWVANVDHVKFLHETYDTACEDMETNAAANICHNSGVPFIGIRVISDNITTGEKFVRSSAYTAEKFVLLVMEQYINDVLKK